MLRAQTLLNTVSGTVVWGKHRLHSLYYGQVNCTLIAEQYHEFGVTCNDERGFCNGPLGFQTCRKEDSCESAFNGHNYPKKKLSGENAGSSLSSVPVRRVPLHAPQQSVAYVAMPFISYQQTFTCNWITMACGLSASTWKRQHFQMTHLKRLYRHCKAWWRFVATSAVKTVAQKCEADFMSL